MALRRMIHISDLHFGDVGMQESMLQKNKYMDDLMDSLKTIESLDTVIISGDIVDKGGSERAYKKADSLIEQLRNQLKVQHILCVPGNHDVNRDLLKAIRGRENVDPDTLWMQYDQKLEYYWEFIDRNGLPCCSHSGLVSCLILQNPTMLLLGLDSTDQIGIEDGCGFINVDNLKKELKSLLGEPGEKYKEYTKIAVLHHRPIIYESGSQKITDNNSSKIGEYGTCDMENWKRVRGILLSYDVHYVLTGHVHGSQSGQVRSCDSLHDEVNYSTVGSLGVDFSSELKQLLETNYNKELLKKFDDLQCYESLNGNHNAYNIWTFNDNGLVQEDQYKYLVDEGSRRWCLWKTKIFEGEKSEQIDAGGVFDKEVTATVVSKEEPENYGEKILECVRDHELYKTGHYHWKNTARINWIDTSYFFQHREMMFYIARGINDLFEKNATLKETECIIGLGIKGSILLSYVRFLFPEKKCSYLPENAKEYNRYEMTLFDENEKIQSIAVLTDVVHSGNTIKRFSKDIHKKINKFLSINIVTIFDATPNGIIANVKGKAKITLFSLAKLKVIDCQGGGENCDIYIKKLANVIEYKETSYEKSSIN